MTINSVSNTTASIVLFASSIRPESRVNAIKDWLKDQSQGYMRSDRLNSPWHRLPSSFGASRKEVKARLKRIGKTLGEFKKSDRLHSALEWVNREEYLWRDYFESREIFQSIFDEDFFICNDCNVLELYDNGNTCYDDYRVCESCVSNYRYSDNQDTYISEDDYYSEQEENDDEDEDEECFIGSYHSSTRQLGKIPSSFDQHKKPIYLGLELEMEIGSDYSRNDKAEQLLNAIGTAQVNGKNYQYALCEGDGSLEHGFEMVTGYTGLDTHAKQLEFFKQRFRGAKSHDTRTCGLHVHICKSDASLLHCAKMVLFINDSNNQKMIRAIARRDGASYSKILNKKASYDWLKQSKGNNKKSRILQLNQDRYEALNFHNEKTIEFRIFKGTLKFESIMASLEFTYATWHFCKDTGTNGLTTANFLNFICLAENRKFTRHLRQYFKERNFILPKGGEIKSNPRIDAPVVNELTLSTEI